MSKKVFIAAALAAGVAALGAYFASPVLAANALRAAAHSGDADKLQELVDFPAVRESLKGQLNALVMQSMQSDPGLQDNPFAGFAAMVAPMIVNQAVDGYVTAEGIAAMMAASRPHAGTPAAGAPDSEAEPAPPGGADAKFEHRYKDLDTYVITSVNGSDPKARFGFVLHRRGLFDWKLTRIELPKALLSNSTASVTATPPVRQEPRALLNQWADQNEACRGGSGDPSATERACEARNVTDAELAKAGWCYGENAAYGYQSEWRPCGSPKFASLAAAEKAAEAEAADGQR